MGGHAVVLIERMAGAIADPASPTAFAHRHNAYDLLVEGARLNPDDDAAEVAWAEEIIADSGIQAETDGGRYVNYLQDADAAAVRAAYGSSYERLAQFKWVYDPDNTFRANNNVAPASQGV